MRAQAEACAEERRVFHELVLDLLAPDFAGVEECVERCAALVDARDIKNVVRRVRPELELGVRVPAAVRERVFAVQRPAAAVVRARERRRDIAERVVDDRLIEDVRARMRL